MKASSSSGDAPRRPPQASIREAKELLPAIRNLIPPLTAEKHKGQAGKIAVVGGCQEYTGAPFFAAYSALNVGVDLSQVFCEASAAPVIKGYSPELIVHPYIRDSEAAEAAGVTAEAAVEKALEKITPWLSRMSCVVVGPGLGRDAVMQEVGRRVIVACREREVPLVIDADGLWILNGSPETIKGYRNAILTPNVVEFQRLSSALGINVEGSGQSGLSSQAVLELVTQLLDGPTVVRKGNVDAICYSEGRDSSVTVLCGDAGSLRRCGGQGDVLSGSMAAFMSWANKASISDADDEGASPGGRDGSPMVPAAALPVSVLAAAGACLVTRHASSASFAKRRRAMMASSMIDELGAVMDELFGLDGR